MPKIKILTSMIIGLMMTVELLSAQAAVKATTSNIPAMSVSSTPLIAGRGRRHRSPVYRSGGGRGGFGRMSAPIPGIFIPAAGQSRCTKGRGGGVCR